MTDTQETTAGMILYHEAARVKAIDEAKQKEKLLSLKKEKIDEASITKLFEKQQALKEFNFYCCVPNIKVPTNEQIMMLRFGSKFVEIKEQARQHFKKEEQ